MTSPQQTSTTSSPFLIAATVFLLYLGSIALLRRLYLSDPSFDLDLLDRVHLHATPTGTLLASSLSFIGSPRTLWPSVLLAAFILWRSRLRFQAAFLLSSMGASGLLETVVKVVARRQRPNVPWAYVRENTYSFPSGHATLAFALYGTITYLARNRPPRQRAAIAFAAAVMIAGIGLSRLYLGAHNPTDVLAGYLSGAACLLAVILFVPDQIRPPG